MALARNLFFLFLFHLVLLNSAGSKCPKTFNCGNLSSLEFPLYREDPDCGLFKVDKCDSEIPIILLTTGLDGYEILEKTSANKLLIRDLTLRERLATHSCSAFTNLPLPNSPYSSFTHSGPSLTLFACSNRTTSGAVQDYFKAYNHKTCPLFTLYYRYPATDLPATLESSIPQECSMYQLPVKSNEHSGELFNLLTYEYILEWKVSDACYKCHHEGGQCLSNSENEFQCRKGNRKLNILLLGAVTMSVLAFTAILLFLFIRRKQVLLLLLRLRKAEPESQKDIELFLKNNGNLAPKSYKYSDLQIMTKSFTENLGEGGYGSVYKGKLPDGRLVAVKILNKTEGNGEEFMNEVAIISRTSHINIVTLLGFCFEGSKRALIYEFMPNGSLEKFIQNTAISSEAWEKLFEIAVGIARGLEYLHQGCNMRILHFDIKPHNILLDKDLTPKISDFGLAKLCPNRSSIVSMLVARGTIGYIAPEVFCWNFGEVSYKSDVYSYGMMVLEIAGGRKNIDPGDLYQTNEIYFPQYIYKQLEMDTEKASVDWIVNQDESLIVKKKLIIVGLWCIQTDPKDRPTMSKVVEMLEGKLESLPVPPKPYLSSHPRSAPNFSTFESM